jgi:thiol-disulfide isomerase/thioredoxin
MSRVQELQTDAEWEAALKESKGFGGKALVVDFSATWCARCLVGGGGAEARRAGGGGTRPGRAPPGAAVAGMHERGGGACAAAAACSPPFDVG